MSIESLPTLMVVGLIGPPIYTSLTVHHSFRILTFAHPIGIDDNLAQKLTRSLPPDVLRAFVELYCDVMRESSEARGV
jgi:hypothetical protein